MAGVRFTCEIDTGDLEAAWAESCRVLSDGLRRGVAMGCDEGAAQARASHPYKDRTGALTSSTKGRVTVSTPGAAEGVIEATARYASFVEEGTRPHEIRPRKAKALHWTDAEGEHFAQLVHHPGTPSLPFIGPAVQKAERVIEREVDIAQAKVAEIMSR